MLRAPWPIHDQKGLGTVTLFDAPAEGELFDTRPYDAPTRADAPAAADPRPVCPVCGGHRCACEARGHTAVRLGTDGG